MTDPRTPTWWRALPAWAQIGLLTVLLPGVVAHEGLHFLVAVRWDDATLDWDAVACDFADHQDCTTPLAVAVAAAAPLLCGYTVAVGVFLLLGTSGGVSVPDALLTAVSGLGVAAIGAYGLANYALFTLASLADLSVVVTYLREHRARTTTDSTNQS